MKNLKLLMVAFATLLFVTVGCKKDNADKGGQLGELSITATTGDLEKSYEKDGDFDCDSEVHYAMVYIDGNMMRLPVFYFNGMLMRAECSSAEGQWSGTMCISQGVSQ